MRKSFSISPRALSHFGEDLIKNESIAILELVKNSYDACANKCEIEFIVDRRGKLKELIISDDGFGMNKKIIENVWLTVGTDYKYKNIKPNICDRIPLGEKGIGRLSVHKLGNRITLISKKAKSKEVSVFIDWSELEDAEDFNDFKVDLIERESPSIFKKMSGTMIKVEELKKHWESRHIRELYRSLNSLNSPFGESNDNFEVEIKSNNPKLFEGLPDFDDIKDSALYHGRCVMEGGKIVEFKYSFEPWDSLTKIDEGRSKDELLPEEYNIIDEDRYSIDLDEYEIGTIEFDILIFETDTQIFNYVNAEKQSIKKYLKQNGGIRVYRDGIRVYDYGERDNDWLGIDLKRVSRVGGNVSNNIIIGSVKINRKDSFGLREKTNREGFIENDSYQKFASAVNYALSLIVLQRNIDKQQLTSLYKKYKVIEPVLSDLDEVVQIVEDKIKSTETKNELLKYLSRIAKQYKEVKEVLIKSANAGLNLGVVIHEIEKLIAQLTGCLERKEMKKAINISKMLERIIRGYMAMIKKSSIKLTKLSDIVESAIENYEFRFIDHKIKVISNYSDFDLKAYLAEAESISVLANLLDNAIYWLSYARRKNRMLSIYLTKKIKGYNSIIVSDNGPGFNIPTDVAIEPFITGKPHNIGSGLGLHIAHEMMKAMKGKLIFLDEDDIGLPKIAISNKINKAIIALCFKSDK